MHRCSAIQRFLYCLNDIEFDAKRHYGDISISSLWDGWALPLAYLSLAASAKALVIAAQLTAFEVAMAHLKACKKGR